MLIKLIILIWITPWCLCEDWEKPYLIDPQNDQIKFFLNESSETDTTILMDEEIPVPFKLATVNYANSSNSPSITFNVGNMKEFDTYFELDENQKWSFMVKKKIDYEQIKNKFFSIDITIKIKGIDFIHTVTIRVNNLVDEDPTVIHTGPCIVEEYLKPPYDLKDCIFHVNDADTFEPPGFNDITVDVIGSSNENEIFELHIDSKTSEDIFYHLVVKEELVYNKKPLYNFRVNFTDYGNNKASVVTIVEVKDTRSTDPIWIAPFTYARFNEKQDYTQEISARDGDSGINDPIYFELSWDEENYSRYISIENRENNTGLVKVKGINRDKEKKEIFKFSIVAIRKCPPDACKREFKTSNQGLIVINDVNDNLPEINISPKRLIIKENTFLTLNFDIFNINDLDMGDFATYKVQLTDIKDSKIEYSKAFSIVPGSGYQETDPFQINIINHKLLDYEDPDWKSFKIIVKAVETYDVSRFREQVINIELQNWNDELPIFTEEQYSASIKENNTKGELVGKVQADDRDIGDHVEYSILGTIYEKISINKLSGEIIADEALTFDYERQTKVYVQIMANDTLGEPYHSVITQLVINVIDVNDETPTMKLPRKAINITENSNNTILTTEIEGRDPDTTADLEFIILWNETYATKLGKEVENRSLFENCFIIDTIKNEKENVYYGHLRTNDDFTKEQNIDYEEYDVIYLTIRVIDKCQEINDWYADGMTAVLIDDVNDCPPEFVGDTLKENRTVVELSRSQVQIGTILAIDRDGPGNNIISYYITPLESDLPPNWIEITENEGILRVKENEVIDCDVPKRFYLNYTISLTDGVHVTNDTISIFIYDTNSKKPEIGKTPESIEIKEKIEPDGKSLIKINATDLDRDYPHNKLTYTIDFIKFPNLQKYFSINMDNGLISITQGKLLDYDEGDKEHKIYIVVKDNLIGEQKEDQRLLTVKLLDVNDHAPELPDPTLYKPSISESAQIGEYFNQQLTAIDIDSKDNGRVSFEILSIESSSIVKPRKKLEIEIEPVENVENTVKFKIISSLVGLYGEWKVKIFAKDHGEKDKDFGSQNSTETYIFTVNAENIHDPVIVFPTNTSLQLRYQTNILEKLTLFSGETLKPFTAEDPDGDIFGDVTFELKPVSNNPEHEEDYTFFLFSKTDRLKSDLMLKQVLKPAKYYIKIQAIDGGGKTSNEMELIIVFIDPTANPYFNVEEQYVYIHENKTGLHEYEIIVEGIDPINEGSVNTPNYYFINYNYRPDDAKYFLLDKSTRNLTLAKELDRESIEKHTFEVYITRSPDGLNDEIPNESKLKVTCIVLDVNDNPPIFNEKEYGIGITTEDRLEKYLFTINATDADLNDTVSYRVKDDKFIKNGENLENLPSQPFILNETTGQIFLHFLVKSEMSGYIEFTAEAYDCVDHTDEAGVKIYIIDEESRVSFLFLNDYDQLNTEENRRVISEIFGKHYGFSCFVDEFIPSNQTTDVRTHFIKDREVVSVAEIQRISGDPIFLAELKLDLTSRELYLHDIPSKNELNGQQEKAENFKVVLIIVSVILSLLCIIITVVFFVKNKRLQLQLKAFKAVNFGSNTSDLNRRNAPRTNDFAIEGANPVLNNTDIKHKTVFDNDSIQSDESDFSGIANDPTFMPNERKASANPALIEEIRRRSVNPMVTLSES